MPIPEEFIKKRTEVTISRASLEAINCKSCGAKIDTKDIQNGYARCGYCGSTFALAVDGKGVA
jgi:DNA-directed RNA polymerase subunit RPC12/RpoP